MSAPQPTFTSGRLRRLSALCTALSAAVLLGACGLCAQDEVARVPSPDGVLEAVVVRLNCGATTNYGYSVYLVAKGRIVAERVDWPVIKRTRVAFIDNASKESSISSEKYAWAHGLDVHWLAMDQVAIEYSSARKSTVEPTFVADDRTVHIEIHEGIEYPSLEIDRPLVNRERIPAEKIQEQ